MDHLGIQKELDGLLRQLTEEVRLLPALTAENAVDERRRLVAALRGGEVPVPNWKLGPRRPPAHASRWLDRAALLSTALPHGDLYRARLDELELELSLVHALGDVRRVRPLAARRFGTGTQKVPTANGESTLATVASGILDRIVDTPEEPTVAAEADHGPSVASMMRELAASLGIELRVRIEPRLAAAAAAGDRTVFLAPRSFGRREALRLVVHEVLGHVVSAANGRAQPLRILEFGTAESFEDQEGLAIWLEEKTGALDGRRLRTLAARVVAADWMHAGASFGETARRLVRDHGFECEAAIHLSERAYRGGGVARDVGYLAGWLRVRAAIERGTVQLDEIRWGRVGLGAVPALRALAEAGILRAPPYRPSLVRSLRATGAGTSFETSPPNDAASLTRFELT